MSFELMAERKIREAMAKGELEAVADGRSLDLDGYFSVPEHLRMGYWLLKSAGCVPEEVEYLNEVARLKAALDAAPDEAARQLIRRSLADATLRLDLALERATRFRRE